MVHVESSPRAGVQYAMTRGARWHMRDIGFGDPEKALLTTMLIDQHIRGVDWPEATYSLVEAAKHTAALSVHRRADRLLQYVSNLISTVGEYVSLGTPSAEPDSFGTRVIAEGPTFWGALAWSESLQAREVGFLMDYLRSQGWIKWQGDVLSHLTVTVDGYSHMATRASTVDSSQAFVAMWFDTSLMEAYEKGIKLAVQEAGYTPIRVDQKEHINKIDDEIIAEIRRARFLVADFTHGRDGARGGVYYEAGFAHGLDLPVIFTCRADALEALHFDTSHYSHIVWTDPADLREKLKTRILAVIGEGPEARRTP